jgi:hypothetical protein
MPPAHESISGSPDWHVSRICESGARIRLARLGESVFIGNMSDPDGPVSKFTTEEWRQVLVGAGLGDFGEIAWRSYIIAFAYGVRVP